MEHPITVDDDGVISRYQGPIARYLSSSAGRAKLAQSMAMPLRTRLDYQGVARKVLSVEPLPQGALPTYDRDIDVSAIVGPIKHNFICVNNDGRIGRHKTPAVIPSLPYQRIARRALKTTSLTHDSIIINEDGEISKKGFLSAGHVTVPEFEIYSNPSINISDVRQRRFNLIDRAFRKREVIIDDEGQITAGPK